VPVVVVEQGLGRMNSEFVGRLERVGRRAERRQLRVLAIEALGPLTILAGLVWAVAQPYRIVFLSPEGKGFYDFLVQPPLLVVAVGAVFSLVVARGLLRDLEEAGGAEG
jgi:hypothetical protein